MVSLAKWLRRLVRGLLRTPLFTSVALGAGHRSERDSDRQRGGGEDGDGATREGHRRLILSTE
ncbi:MAG: hypothetical protein CL476_02470 [Acidobacteria bacterium]|jgi:hypothetical protein|nr:hypothetical protein [Acidobacteriota bacterium]